MLGDSILFVLGSRAGPGLQAKMFSSERAQERLGVAGRLVHERTWLLIASDFLPGGRTAAMFAAGAFAVSIGVAVAIGVVAEAIYRVRRRSLRRPATRARR